MRLLHVPIVALCCLLAAGCAAPERPVLVDPNATPETQALFVNLQRIARDHVLFGHQDALAYGYQWFNEPGRSDVKEVAGSYPAVYGWELADIELGHEENIDGVNFDLMRGYIQQGYQRGGVITVSWHMNNPVSGGNAWDTTRAVPAVLPGGSHHDVFLQGLDRFAAFIQSLEVGEGADRHLVPVIFRPWHEQSGHWFWWGAPHTDSLDYQRLYRFTVEYLRDVKGVHNLLYAYSPNSLSEYPREQYWSWYPGDAYVDILGVDDYYTMHDGYGNIGDGIAAFSQQLRWLVEQAEARGKIPALTETGLDRLEISDWFTSKLLASIKADSVASRIAYLLVWRNTNFARESRDHFFAPYPGHASAEDFVRFTQDPLILLEDELPDLYTMPRRR